LEEVTQMAEKSKRDLNADQAPGPGDPDWERNREVIHGEVDPKDPNKGSRPDGDGDEDADK
jgi:hypothetical protein